MAKAQKKLEAALEEDKTPEEPSGGDLEVRPDNAKTEVIEVRDDEPDDKPEDKGDERTRDEKKRDRGRGFAQERDEWKTRAEEAAALNERLMRVIEQRERQSAPSTPGKDEVVDRLESKRASLLKERGFLGDRLQVYGAKITQEQIAEITKRAEEIDDELYNIRADIRDHKRGADRPQRPQGPQYDEGTLAVRMQYQNVLRNPQAAAFASGEFLRLVAKGAPRSPETGAKAFQAAEREFGLGATREVSQGQREKYRSAPQSNTGNSDRTARTYTMTPERRKLADARFSYIKEPKKRYDAFAREMLKKQDEREARKRAT